MGINCIKILYKNHPSQTLSPCPSVPTLLNPSFQSPEPIKGKPCFPNLNERWMARRQCSYRDAFSVETPAGPYFSTWSSPRVLPPGRMPVYTRFGDLRVCSGIGQLHKEARADHRRTWSVHLSHLNPDATNAAHLLR